VGGVDQITAPLSGPDVVDKHVAHQQLAIGPADQVVVELQGDDPRNMLLLGDCPNLLLTELAELKAALESQHPPSPSRTNAPAWIWNRRAGASLMWVKASIHRLVCGPSVGLLRRG
jgi:hypothetical protein